MFRWVTHAELVLNRMTTNMPLLLNDLPGIGSDCGKFSDKTRAEAKGLTYTVSNIKFHGLLHLVSDITNNFNFYSSKLQEAGGLLIGKGHFNCEFKNFIDLLKLKYGKSSTKFLTASHVKKMRTPNLHLCYPIVTLNHNYLARHGIELTRKVDVCGSTTSTEMKSWN